MAVVAITAFTGYIIPVVVVLILLIGIVKKKNIFDLFIDGAKEGISTAVRILPALIALMTAVAMFRASGALDIIVGAVRPFCQVLRFPAEAVPLAIMRPVSGSGALSVLEAIFRTSGPDSFAGRVASVLQGSTETTFYTLAVYFGSVGVTKTRHAVPATLAAELIGVVMSAVAVAFFFR